MKLKYSLPHLLGLHYVFKDERNKKDFVGKLGFEKLLNNEITIKDITNRVKNTKLLNIQRRITYLPMFINNRT